MSRLLVLALASPFALIGAMHPHTSGQPVPSAHNPIPGPTTYRACRPGPGDDRCIQLYERGVRTAYARWQRDRRGAPVRVAMGGPIDQPDPQAFHHPDRRHDAHGDHARHADDARHAEHGDHADHSAGHRCAHPAPADGSPRGM